MALSKGNNQVAGNLIILRPVTRDENKHDIPATFVAFEKVDEKWVKKDTFSQVTGNIKGVEIHEDTYEGNVKHSVKVFLSDAEASETYLLDLRLNILNRSLLNALVNLKSTENVNISVYQNKKGFAASTIRQDGNMVGWKFDWATVPKPVDINHPKTGKKLQSDYAEVDEFFLLNVESWAKELGVWKVQGEAKAAPVAAQSSKEDVDIDTSSEDADMDW